MRRLRYACVSAVPWLLVLLAGVTCWAAWSWWPRPGPTADAARPARPYPRALLGPSVKEALERMNRKGPAWVSPPDVVE